MGVSNATPKLESRARLGTTLPIRLEWSLIGAPRGGLPSALGQASPDNARNRKISSYVVPKRRNAY